MTTLDADQQRAVETLTDPDIPIAVMTGGPGVGKTFTLNEVVRRLSGNVLLCSPTGKAAKRLSEATGREAKTIHATLKGAPGMGFEHAEGNPLDADVVVVDEASMVDTPLMAALIDALRPGARLLLVGDANQLPPVGAGQPFTDIIRSEKVPVARLTIIHRQTGDSWVIDNAYRIINGERPSTEDTHDFTMLEAQGSEQIVETAVEVILADPEAVVLTPQRKAGAGVNQINIAAQLAVLGDVSLGEKVITLGGGISCRRGDRVMVIQNMRASEDAGGEERYLPNGTTGKCVSVLGDFRGIFEFGGEEFTLGGDKLKLTLAYAMTIHKSQGSGWDHVVVISDPAHAYMLRESGRQLMYTGVTRVQKRLTVIGSATAFEDVALGKMSNLRQTYLKQFYPA